MGSEPRLASPTDGDARPSFSHRCGNGVIPRLVPSDASSIGLRHNEDRIDGELLKKVLAKVGTLAPKYMLDMMNGNNSGCTRLWSTDELSS